MQRNGVVEEPDGLSGLRQPALSDLASLVEEHLPVLPSAKEMGVSPAVSLLSFWTCLLPMSAQAG